MDKYEVYLLELLSAAIRGQEPPEPDYLVDWDRIFSEAAAHEVHTLIYPAVKRLAPPLQPPLDQMKKWGRRCLLSATRQLQYMNESYQVLHLLAESKIPVIVLKGLLLRELYPQPELRTMGDIDLLIKSDDVELAGRLLEAEGYIRGEHIGMVRAFIKPNSLAIDLHYGLLTLESSADLNDFETHIWAHVNYCTVGGQLVLRLSVEDNLIYLLIHMVNHFRSSGFGLRQLCDVVLFVETYGPETDWNYFWGAIQAMGYETFSITILATCRQFLGLGMADSQLYKQREADPKTVLLLIQDIIYSGVFGYKNKNRSFGNEVINELHKSSSLTALYRLVPFFTSIGCLLFPSIPSMVGRYAFLRKCPWLLPIAWLHRLIFAILVRNSPKEIISIFKNTSAIANHRMKLIEKLEL